MIPALQSRDIPAKMTFPFFNNNNAIFLEIHLHYRNNLDFAIACRVMTPISKVAWDKKQINAERFHCYGLKTSISGWTYHLCSKTLAHMIVFHHLSAYGCSCEYVSICCSPFADARASIATYKQARQCCVWKLICLNYTSNQVLSRFNDFMVARLMTSEC